MKAKILLFIAIFFASNIAFSQSPRKFIDTGSVSNQFDYLIKKSNRYQEYKVVNTSWLFKLKANVSDSISASKKEIETANSTIKTQKNTIKSLETEVNLSKNTITELNNNIQSISLFGIQINKGTFKTILFSIIILLTISLLFFISKFKQSNDITNEAKLALKELDEEFEIHRKKAIEREQKVRRQLQDELIKHKKD